MCIIPGEWAQAIANPLPPAYMARKNSDQPAWAYNWITATITTTTMGTDTGQATCMPATRAGWRGRRP